MFHRWCFKTTLGPTGPGHFIHSLTFDEMRDKWITPEVLSMGERHLKSFKNLVSLTIIGLQINYFFDDSDLSRCFGSFCRGVREVRLVRPHGSPRIIVPFIQQFPLIQRLSVEFYAETWSPSPDLEEYTSVGFTGAFQLVSDASMDRGERQLFVSSLLRFPIQYKEISVVGSLGHSWQYLALLRACSKTLEKLRMVDIRLEPWRERIWGWPQDISERQCLSLESCLNLRELFVGVTPSPGPMLEALLASITSTKLTTITFEFVWEEYVDNDLSRIVDLEVWEGIDETLVALADRLPKRGGSRALNVVLSVRTRGNVKLENAKMGAFLEKFKEKGQVTVVPFEGFLQPGKYSGILSHLVTSR